MKYTIRISGQGSKEDIIRSLGYALTTIATTPNFKEVADIQDDTLLCQLKKIIE